MYFLYIMIVCPISVILHWLKQNALHYITQSAFQTVCLVQ